MAGGEGSAMRRTRRCADAKLSYDQLEHDLKTPLAAITAFAEILRDYPELTAPERQDLIERLVAENARLLSTIDRLLRHPSMGRVLS
jgi:signal transduction histidine kinase